MPAVKGPPVHPREGVARAFREAREAVGSSARALAAQLGTSTAAIEALETDDNELFNRYSLTEVCLMAEALEQRPSALLKAETDGPPLPGGQLVALIRGAREAQSEAVLRFEKEVGWRITSLLESPEQLLSDLTLATLEQLCAAVGIDWRRVLVAVEDGRGYVF